MKKPKRTDLKKLIPCSNRHFYLNTSIGYVHVNMNPNAAPEVYQALDKMVTLAYNLKK